MRIAIVDLMFSWPPHGGADVDVYHVARGLTGLGHELCVFVVHDPGSWERGHVEPSTLPFNAKRLDIPPGAMTVPAVLEQVTAALDAWQPDVVLLAQGYFLKPMLIRALERYPILSRCYAHEIACHRDILRFADGASCTYTYADTPNRCRRCALKRLAPAIKNEYHDAWTQEYLASQAWKPEYHALFLAAMRQLRGVVITGEHMREQVDGLCERVHVIPHGVDVRRFAPAPETEQRREPVLFVPGRVEDPAKGFDTALDAARILADQGRMFTLQATLPEGHGGPSWLKSIGKLDYDAMPGAYQQSDICIVPSMWDEPFGIVALEAMASGLPVCASRVGGLQEIVVHEETGLLFRRGDAAELAACLERLLDDGEARRAMGRTARQHAAAHYHWDALIPQYYPALLDGIV